MTRFFALAIFALTLFSSFSQALPIAQITLDRPSYQAGENAHVRYRLVSTPESPAYEFFLSASVNGAPFTINKITDTEFYSKVEALSAGQKTISLSIFLQDKALAGALTEAVRFHDGEITRLTDEISQADPEDIPVLEAERADHEEKRSDAVAKLNSIRRLVGTTSLQFDVNN